MSDFKAKKASNSISAGGPPKTPLGELAALPQLTPSPLSAHRGNNLPSQICIPNSAYGKNVELTERFSEHEMECDEERQSASYLHGSLVVPLGAQASVKLT